MKLPNITRPVTATILCTLVCFFLYSKLVYIIVFYLTIAVLGHIGFLLLNQKHFVEPTLMFRPAPSGLKVGNTCNLVTGLRDSITADELFSKWHQADDMKILYMQVDDQTRRVVLQRCTTEDQH
jgi:hypothetical protein